jgi:hypothetical protein
LLLSVVSLASVVLNTDVHAPPRFDGAGCAVLGEALASGRGYREINDPDSPRHAHFPPGYPAALAVLWRCFGRSVEAAHVFSAGCTVAAVLVAWRWLRTIYRPPTALLLGLALALNWTWGRAGGAIQSEPLYMFWELLTVLIAIRVGRGESVPVPAGIGLGAVLAGCVLIRHVGICLAAAVLLDLGLRARWRAAGTATLTAALLVLPWAGWLAVVHHNTQAEFLVQEGLTARIAGQAVFYLQRMPDQITGPVVEIGTVFHRSVPLAILVNLWAAGATAVIVWGWASVLRNPRRRLAGVIAFLTLAVLLVWPFTEAGRFLIPLVPFVLVGATEGLARLLAWAELMPARDWAARTILVISIPYAAYAAATGRAAAQRQTHSDFDFACRWLAGPAARPGMVMTRHPGEIYWQTRRQAVTPGSSEVDAIARRIDQLGVTYLLIDEDRYASETRSPLANYVARYRDRAALAWSRSRGSASIQIWENLRAATRNAKK